MWEEGNWKCSAWRKRRGGEKRMGLEESRAASMQKPAVYQIASRCGRGGRKNVPALVRQCALQVPVLTEHCIDFEVSSSFLYSTFSFI